MTREFVLLQAATGIKRVHALVTRVLNSLLCVSISVRATRFYCRYEDFISQVAASHVVIQCRQDQGAFNRRFAVIAVLELGHLDRPCSVSVGRN